MLNKADAQRALDMEFYHSDFGGYITFRALFKKALINLWHEEEGFSGKRPFGNSGWTNEVYVGLARNKLIKSNWRDEWDIDKDDMWDNLSYDNREGDGVIGDMIKAL